jgi:Double zinc ribbon
VNVLASGISDFFSSGTWLVVRNLLIFFAVLFWASLGYWVYKDARRRIEDPLLVIVSTLVGLVLPYFGPFVYMLFRPPEYLEDVRERELEIREIEERLATELRCPVCRSEVESSFLVCPVCTTRLKQACPTCKAPLEAIWQICPHCATPIASAPVTSLPGSAAPRARRRRE